MNVTLSVRHGQLTAEHQAAVIADVEKLGHFDTRLREMAVTVDLAGLEKAVELVGHADHGHRFAAHAAAPELMAAVHAAVGKLKQQLKHVKESLQDHRRDPAHGGTTGLPS